jgi:hypothetical protein
MGKIGEETTRYLNALKSAQGSQGSQGDARKILADATLKLVQVVRSALVWPGPTGDAPRADALGEARSWVLDQLLERSDEPGEGGSALTRADLAVQLGTLDTLSALLRLNPAHDVPDVLRDIARDNVKMSILYLVENGPRNKTELSDRVPKGQAAEGRSPASMTLPTQALLRAGLTYETVHGSQRLVHISNQGRRLLALVRAGHVQGAEEPMAVAAAAARVKREAPTLRRVPHSAGPASNGTHAKRRPTRAALDVVLYQAAVDAALLDIWAPEAPQAARATAPRRRSTPISPGENVPGTG